MKALIERVTGATVAEWIALRVELWPHEAKAELERQGRELLTREQPAVAFLLRDEAGAAIAMAEATIRRDYVNGCSTSPVAFLEGIYVRPAWRRQGAARLLCQAVEAWGREQGCREFASDAPARQRGEPSHAPRARLRGARAHRLLQQAVRLKRHFSFTDCGRLCVQTQSGVVTGGSPPR